MRHSVCVRCVPRQAIAPCCAASLAGVLLPEADLTQRRRSDGADCISGEAAAALGRLHPGALRHPQQREHHLSVCWTKTPSPFPCLMMCASVGCCECRADSIWPAQRGCALRRKCAALPCCVPDAECLSPFKPVLTPSAHAAPWWPVCT